MATALLNSFLRRISQKPSELIFVYCLTLLLIVGILDFSTGYELHIDVLYFPGVAIAAWTGNRRIAMSTVVLAVVTFFTVKILMGAPYAREFYRYFAAIDWLLSLYLVAEICLSARALFDAAEQSSQQLRKATEKLEIYSSELAAIMDAVPAAIFVAEDAACERITGNKIAHTLLGLPMMTNLSASNASAPKSRPYRVQKNGEEIPVPLRPMQLAASGASQMDYSFELAFDDGSIKSLRGDAVTLLDANGCPAGAVGAFLDVTERKRMELALEESLAFLNKALASAMDAVCIFDTKGNLTHISNSCRDFMRFDPSETTARTFQAYLQLMDLYTPSGQVLPPEMWVLPRALQGESASSAEYIIRRKDTGESWIASFSYGPIYNGGGKVIGGILAARDITELRRLELEKNELEQRVLKNQKLESLGILAGGIAHTFNNQLQVILGHTELVSRALPAGLPFQANLQAIESACNHASRLARHMLDYTGHGHFKLVPVVLNDVIRDALLSLEGSIPKSISIRCEGTVELPMMEGDVIQIKQVAVSLITNALESIGDGEGSVSISTGTACYDRDGLARLTASSHATNLESLLEGTYVCLDVTDTGTGMDGDTLSKIFDPFFTTKFPGRGLGLSSALGIVRGHRGAITVDSEVGRGTTFRVLFPAIDPALHVPSVKN